MLKIYSSTPDGLCEPDVSGEGRVVSGAWFNLTKPGTSELREVSELTGIPMDFLQAALDREDPSRIEVEDDYVLIITNVPKVDVAPVHADR